MAGKNQHVVPRSGGWAVVSAGSSRAGSTHRTQQAAVQRAIQVAKQQKSEVLTHGRNGQICSKDSYGNDPNPPRDAEH